MKETEMLTMLNAEILNNLKQASAGPLRRRRDENAAWLLRHLLALVVELHTKNSPGSRGKSTRSNNFRQQH